MCRHSYSLSHEKSETKIWIVTCFMYPRVFTKEGSCGAPQNILGLRAPQSFNPALYVGLTSEDVNLPM